MPSLEIHQDEGEKLDEILTKFWEISSVPKTNKDNGNAVHAKFHKSIQFNKHSGRYTVKLPWRDTAEDLPTNFALPKKRLVNLQCSLNKRDPELISKYDEQLQSQVKQGFIEVVNDPSIHSGKLHYIPHFPVFKADSSTTKMRIVYDASAKKSPTALSLNDCLHTGSNLMQEILLTFRINQKAFAVDIEKAFL